MDKERFESYARYIAEPGIDGLKIADELRGTLLLQEFDQNLWGEMIRPLDAANQIVPFVSEKIIKAAEKDAGERGADKIDQVFQAVQMAIHPLLSNLLSDGFKIDNDGMMVAATHIGITELSEIYQTCKEEDKMRIQLYALYFAGAQARILGFRTTSMLLAANLKDEAYLRLDNPAVIARVEDDEELKKAQTSAIFEGHKVTEIRRIGKDGKFFIA